MENSKEEVYSVSGLTRQIKALIRGNFPRVDVSGEIARFTRYGASGHMYFSLADENARLDCVMFKHANQKLNFQPEEGMDVVVSGRLDVYEARGNYQLIADRMFVEGRGELEREFNELKDKLEAEGALAADRKRRLPDFPGVIGVVTSGDGAAFWDIVQTIRRRCPVVRIVLYPSRVNGRDAAGDVAAAIRRLPEIVDLDCLIVGRGGGSPEDLWGFNVEQVARAILDCPVPVISAVGHEVDVTISDLVADHRSPTPTAAGEEVAPALVDLQQRLVEQRRRLENGIRRQIDSSWDQLRFVAEKPVFATPCGWLRPFADRLQNIKEQLSYLQKIYLDDKKSRLKNLSERLQALNPQGVLRRGYAIVNKDKNIVSSAAELKKDDILDISWHDGSVRSRVRDIRLDK
ncbi:MAG: exodeoxyribonuclease VII large subunit [bacterium]